MPCRTRPTAPPAQSLAGLPGAPPGLGRANGGPGGYGSPGTPSSPAPLDATSRESLSQITLARPLPPLGAGRSAPVSPPRSQGSPAARGPLTTAGSVSDAAETRSEGGASEQIAADAAATMAALAGKEVPFDAFSYAFFGATGEPSPGLGGGLGDLMGELEGGEGEELEPCGGGEVARGAGGVAAEVLGAKALLGAGALDLAPDQAEWLRAAAATNQVGVVRVCGCLGLRWRRAFQGRSGPAGRLVVAAAGTGRGRGGWGVTEGRGGGAWGVHASYQNGLS